VVLRLILKCRDSFPERSKEAASLVVVLENSVVSNVGVQARCLELRNEIN